MDRRGGGNGGGGGGGAGNGGMRDYVDPWAHNGNNGSSPMMGGSGPLNNFNLGNVNNNGMGNTLMGQTTGPNNGNNGGGFGSSMDMDKTSTQVTIPKDVSFESPVTLKQSNKHFVFHSWLVPLSERAAVAFVAFVPSLTLSFRSTKHCPGRRIASSPSLEHQNRSKQRNTCFSRGKLSQPCFVHQYLLLDSPTEAPKKLIIPSPLLPSSSCVSKHTFLSSIPTLVRCVAPSHLKFTSRSYHY